MEFDQIKAGIRGLKPDNTRVDNESYFEVVIGKDSVSDVIKLFEGALGPQAWPSKSRLPRDIQKIIGSFGGIRKGQSLFFNNKDGVCLFAMLWPWQDGEKVTIRFGKV